METFHTLPTFHIHSPLLNSKHLLTTPATLKHALVCKYKVFMPAKIVSPIYPQIHSTRGSRDWLVTQTFFLPILIEDYYSPFLLLFSICIVHRSSY